jgi:bifunctional non-homologous end joining protein LigD
VCKTSGATGMHIYIPMGAKYTFEEVKQFANLLVHLVHERLPDLTSLERSPGKRQKKVYLDYLQNNFAQTVVAPYAVRPRPGAPVSTPLKWSEVKGGLNPTQFTIKTVLKRFEKVGDLFKPILGKGINLPAILKKMKV